MYIDNSIPMIQIHSMREGAKPHCAPRLPLKGKSDKHKLRQDGTGMPAGDDLTLEIMILAT